MEIMATKAESSSHALESSGSAGIALEVHRDACRRLAGLAITFFVGYGLFYWYGLILAKVGQLAPPHLANTIGYVCAIAVSLWTYFLGRSEKIPVHKFATKVLIFQIVSSITIGISYWGWQTRVDSSLESAWTQLGSGGDYRTAFVPAFFRGDALLARFKGVGAVGFWSMIIPFVVPLSTMRASWGGLVSVLSFPLILYLSVATHGIPDHFRQWLPRFLADQTIPSLMMAGLGVYGSRAVYQLTRELSRAKRMGSYQLVEKIGAGGMGEVWRAKHRLLVRPAAIKLIRAESIGRNGQDSRTALARFEREAQATAGLTSPHSIEIYDFGITEEGTFYYVMELLDGLDLRSLVERFGPVPPERAVHLLRQTCHSLADAHAHGLIHRDVKPANVFACRRGLDHDYVKVLDFGLVKQSDGPGADRTQLTGEGIASGTPAFMSPEMATGERQIDARTDVYALGCVAYWLLTGKLVFEGDTAMKILLQHVRDLPVRPSARSEVELPEELDLVIMECLEKRPELRPADARILEARFAACARLLPHWDPERAEDWWSKHMPVKPPGIPSPAW
jgi:tRNA A-37 threonylcarbamoyl transferase component Bud32